MLNVNTDNTNNFIASINNENQNVNIDLTLQIFKVETCNSHIFFNFECQKINYLSLSTPLSLPIFIVKTYFLNLKK